MGLRYRSHGIVLHFSDLLYRTARRPLNLGERRSSYRNLRMQDFQIRKMDTS
jgi:hypothetical protein